MSTTNPFGPDTPNTPTSERMDSALDNFVKQFFGTVTKSLDADGNVVWELPAPLDEAEPITGYPRNEGEGLGAYIARVLTAGQWPNSVEGKNAYGIAPNYHGGDTPKTQPVKGATVAISVDRPELFSAGQYVYIPGCGYYTVAEKTGSVLVLTNLFTAGEMTGQLAENALFPDHELTVLPSAPRGAAGAAGAKGDTGDAGTVVVDNVTLESYTDSGIVKVRAKAAGIDRSHLRGGTGSASAFNLGLVAAAGGLKFSSVAGHGDYWGVDAGGLAANVDNATLVADANSLRVKTGGIQPEHLAESIRNGTLRYSSAGGTIGSNIAHYTVVLPVAPTDYFVGMEVKFLTSSLPNTGQAYLAVNGLAEKEIVRQGKTLIAGDIVANTVVTVVYNGTKFELQSPPESRAAYSEAKSASTAVLSFSHGLACVPANVRVVLVCTTADAASGAAKDDEMPITNFVDGSNNALYAVFADANAITVARNSSTVRTVTKTGGSLTGVTAIANFSVKVYASKYFGG